VDFLVPAANRKLLVIEARATRSVMPEMALPLNKLSRSISQYQIQKYMVHLSPKESQEKEILTLSPGVKAVSVAHLAEIFK